jgi:TRAP transporter 4TM/12TM fusion protein
MRNYSGPMNTVVKVIAAGAASFAVFNMLHLFYALFEISLYQIAFRALFTGLILVLTFLIVPATKSAAKDKLPWYDAILALLSLFGGLYPFIFYKQIALRAAYANNFELVLGIIMILIVLEACRRTSGWALLIILTLFCIYAPFCNYFPGMLEGIGYSFPRVIGHLYLYEDGMFGLVMGVISTIVVAYLLFGEFLFGTGVGKFLTDISYGIFGRFSGGTAKGAVIASGSFGMISGSPVSDVVITGSVNIPLLIKTGYKDVYAGALEAVASTGGALMPPVMGSVAFIMAEFLDISYADVCIAAVWPAILYYASIFLQVHFQSKKMGIKGRPVSELPPLKSTFSHGWIFFTPLLVLVYFLLIARYDAVWAAFYAIFTAFLVGLLRKETRMGPKKILASLENTSLRLTTIVPVCAGAGLIIGSLGLTGLGIRMSSILITLAHGNALLLLIIAAGATIVMSMGIPWTGCYILLALLVAPTLQSMGIIPKAAHLFLLYMGLIAFITPPVSIAVYAACSISKTALWPTGLRACQLGIVAYLVPFFFVFSPALILEDSLPMILLWMAISAVIVFGLAAGVEGFVIKRAGWFQRVLFFGGGVIVGMPWWIAHIIGAGLVAAGLILHFFGKQGVSNNKERSQNAGIEMT